MRVEAIRIENGFFIPMIDTLKNISQDRIWVDITDEIEEDNYSFLDKLIGMCESGITDASVNHDEIIYRERDKR
jgi:hypothetical protein